MALRAEEEVAPELVILSNPTTVGEGLVVMLRRSNSHSARTSLAMGHKAQIQVEELVAADIVGNETFHQK